MASDQDKLIDGIRMAMDRMHQELLSVDEASAESIQALRADVTDLKVQMTAVLERLNAK